MFHGPGEDGRQPRCATLFAVAGIASSSGREVSGDSVEGACGGAWRANVSLGLRICSNTAVRICIRRRSVSPIDAPTSLPDGLLLMDFSVSQECRATAHIAIEAFRQSRVEVARMYGDAHHACRETRAGKVEQIASN